MEEGLDRSDGDFLRKAVVRLGANCVFYSGALKILRMNVKAVADSRQDTKAEVFPFAVLLYHRITPARDPFSPSLPVRVFEGQMRYLRQMFRVLSLAEIFERIRQGKGIEPWTVAVTFDDGYRDNYLYGHRILKQLGLCATLFVATGYIETGRVLWNDRVTWAVQRTEKKGVAIHLHGKERFFSLKTPQEKTRSLYLILEALKRYSETEKRIVLEDLIKELRVANDGPEPEMLSWDDLRQLARDKWDVGSHTVDHPILTRVPESVVRHELTVSKEVLEKELEQPVYFFAYPNGKETDFNAAIKRLVQEAGYKGAVTTLPGFNTGSLDPFEIRRRSPWEEHLPSFAVKTSWAYWRSNGSML
jgi:peptidoglycan/xylan/chitin deacetylase (PgdA/CDA1 family)